MNKIGVGEFVRLLRGISGNPEAMLAFFLGAGASISSEIPGAATLTRKWIGQLHQLRTDGTPGLDEWLSQDFPSYDPDDPAASYADVMQSRFLTPAERQAEIEAIVSGRDPGFGYATLAQFMTREDSGERSNVVITTNFDDLVADALYLYTEKKPLVVNHEALAGFASARRTRPTVIKLHGDALLEPLNTGDETDALADGLVRALSNELRNRGIVFIGYGGNDTGVLKALESLPEEALKWGIYWVNASVPENDFGAWLERNQATWVEHRDFDELAVLLREKFDLPHPTGGRFDQLLTTYRDTFAELQRKSRSDETTTPEVRRAVDDAQQKFENWFSVELEARKYRDSDPDHADDVYRAGIEQFSGSSELLGNYAIFLQTVRKEMDQAESYYQRAIEAGPDDAVYLGNYAIFLKTERKEMDRAESYYQRAIKADPDDAGYLGSYAIFLQTVRKETSQAESYYQRAIEADPDDALALANYAGLLLGRGDEGTALSLLLRLESVPDFSAPERADLRLEVAFYQFANVAKDADERARFLKQINRLLTAGTRSPGWDLSSNLDRAREQEHPEIPMLEVLVDVISEKADIEALDVFEAWISLSDGSGDS